ncbi:MAG: polyphosphate kinase 2 family protein [Acidimicrobiia bacterium]
MGQAKIETSQFRVTPDTSVSLDNHDPDSKAGFEEGKKVGKRALPALNNELSALQKRLWAESNQKLLLVLQATDTGGKDGTIRNVFTGVNPQGVKVHPFGKPTEEELAHDYLWRIHHHTPENGRITVFNRSHYEDVLAVRVRELVPPERWEKRYRHINEFERMLADEGTRIVKVYLNISREEQRERLEARLDDPDRNWKFNKSDLDDRALWGVFREAYEAMLSQTSTPHAPWYVVPANRKWYRNLVVSQILVDTLNKMDPRYPDPEEDLDGVVVT